MVIAEFLTRASHGNPESKRLRDKERCRAKFSSLIQEKDPNCTRVICAVGVGERQNATHSIARKWKEHKEDFLV